VPCSGSSVVFGERVCGCLTKPSFLVQPSAWGQPTHGRLTVDLCWGERAQTTSPWQADGDQPNSTVEEVVVRVTRLAVGNAHEPGNAAVRARGWNEGQVFFPGVQEDPTESLKNALVSMRPEATRPWRTGPCDTRRCRPRTPFPLPPVLACMRRPRRFRDWVPKVFMKSVRRQRSEQQSTSTNSQGADNAR